MTGFLAPRRHAQDWYDLRLDEMSTQPGSTPEIPADQENPLSGHVQFAVHIPQMRRHAGAATAAQSAHSYIRDGRDQRSAAPGTHATGHLPPCAKQ